MVNFKSPGVLTITGESLMDRRVNFRKEIKISKHCLRNEITAKFSDHDGILRLEVPKRIPLPTVSASHQASEEEIGKPKQNVGEDHNVPAAEGTAAILSMLCKSIMKRTSGLQILGVETALKLGASAAVGTYVAYKLTSTG